MATVSDVNIRKAVISNLNNSSFDDVMATITDAVSIDEENVLPGLGVIFEVLWKKCDSSKKNWIVQEITSAVN